MGNPPVAEARGAGPPRRPRTRVAVHPPSRSDRDRRRPGTPRRRPASPGWSAPAQPSGLVTAAEAALIDEWRSARALHDASRSTELSLFLWIANRSLIERAARRTRGLPLEESRQIATVALFRAFERFDPARGVPFAAYAAYWFRKEAQRGRASAAYRSALPVHRLDALGRGESAADANLREIAGASNLDDAPVLRSTAPTPEEATLESLTSAEVRCEVARLAPLPRLIVVLRFGFDGNEPRSNRAVAALVGVSEFTVRTHLSRALRVLRTRLGPTDDVALCPP